MKSVRRRVDGWRRLMERVRCVMEADRRFVQAHRRSAQLIRRSLQCIRRSVQRDRQFVRTNQQPMTAKLFFRSQIFPSRWRRRAFTKASMSPRALRTTILIVTVSTAFIGCENLTPGENAGVFGGVAGAAAGSIARAAGASPTESLIAGASVGAVTAAT